MIKFVYLIPMSDTYQFEDVEIKLNDSTLLYAFGELEYDPCWENGDFDYEGPQGPATHRVGMELTDIEIEDVTIDRFNVSTKVGGVWADVGGVDLSEEKADVDLLPFLEKQIREIVGNDRSFCETVQEAGVAEYDPC